MRLAAFLRAINVGGRNLPMARLREVFEAAGCTNVQTVIASGNVVFDTPVSDFPALEATLEAAVQAALGWSSETFLRTPEELQAVLDATSFPRAEIEAAGAFSVGFLRSDPGAEAVARLMAKESEIDRFAVLGREVYWLCSVRQSDSKFTNVQFERALGAPSTFRGLPTVRRVLDKF